jgi:drug/metabolite transporter (DMT)-like permease
MWGTDTVLRKPLVDGQWSPWTIVLYEHLILTAVVAPVLIRRRRELRALDATGWAAVLVVAWAGSALATLAFTTALLYGNPNVVILLQKTQPLWAMGAAALVVSERPRPTILWLLVPAGLGTYMLSFGTDSPSQAFSGAAGRSALYALVAAAMWGSATAFGRRALRHIDPAVLTASRFTIAVPLLIALALDKQHTLGPPGGTAADGWLRLPLIALGPGLIAMLLYYRGLRTTPAPIATLAELAFPATALIVNYVFLDYSLEASQLVGFAILWTTIALLHRVPVRMPGPPVGATEPVPSRA